MKGERLTDEQVRKIVERCEQKYGYRPGEHQRVIVEHIRDGRQHFHVMWNRVSLTTGRPVWPGHHWKKSKQVAREMEKELGRYQTLNSAKVGGLKTQLFSKRPETASKEKTPTSRPPFMPLPEFCERYKISRTSLYKEANQGRLTLIKRGSRTLIARAEAERWLSSHPKRRPVPVE